MTAEIEFLSQYYLFQADHVKLVKYQWYMVDKCQRL